MVSRPRAKALRAAGVMDVVMGELRRAGPLLEESLALSRALGDPAGVGLALHYLGDVAALRTDPDRAAPFYQQALTVWRELGDQRRCAIELAHLSALASMRDDLAAARHYVEEALALERDAANPWFSTFPVGLYPLALVALGEGDYERARALFEESLAICRRVGDLYGVGRMLMYLGLVAIAQGDAPRARERLGEGLRTLRELGSPLGLARTLEALALLAATTRQAVRAARILGAADTLRAAIDAGPYPVEAARRERLIAAALQVLDGANFEQARAAGRAMPLEDILADALSDDAHDAEPVQILPPSPVRKTGAAPRRWPSTLPPEDQGA